MDRAISSPANIGAQIYIIELAVIGFSFSLCRRTRNTSWFCFSILIGEIRPKIAVEIGRRVQDLSY
jgi:hypothetical protein